MSDINRYEGPVLDLIHKPLWFHERGLSQTRTGYGSKLSTSWMVDLFGRRRRVYAICWSNAVTNYVIVNNERLILPSHLLRLPEAQDP